MSATATATRTWTKVSAGHYRSEDGFEAIRESDGKGWSLWAGSRRAAFVGTYAQARAEAANHAAPIAAAKPVLKVAEDKRSARNNNKATLLQTFHNPNARAAREAAKESLRLALEAEAAQEEAAALSFLSAPQDVCENCGYAGGWENCSVCKPQAAPVAAPTASRPVAGYLVTFRGHEVRCGATFVTEAQAKWMVDLLMDREIAGAEQTFIRLEQGFAKSAGSQFITANKNAPRKAVAKPAAAPAAPVVESNEEVPAGRYALRADGVVKFYKLDRPTEGQWAGWVFLKVQASDETYPIRNKAEKARIIAEIGKDVEGAERLYGQELGKCSRCGRSLTDETSRAYGIGPECRKK